MLNVKSEKSKDTRYRAYKFSLQIINLVKEFPKDNTYMVFTNQLLRAATSCY
ncbi:four helix bundle protein [bacterium]|nr:four helix bundle protein [bacterium]